MASGGVGGRVGSEAGDDHGQGDSGQREEEEENLPPEQIASDRFEARHGVVDDRVPTCAGPIDAAPDGVKPTLRRDRISWDLGGVVAEQDLPFDGWHSTADRRRACA